MYKMLSLVRTHNREAHDLRHYETLIDADKARHEWVHTLQVLRALDIVSEYTVNMYNSEGDRISHTVSQQID